MDVPRTNPSQQGVAAKGVLDFLDAIEHDPLIDPHGLIIQRHGQRIVEGYWAPHSADRLRLVYSLSKTFTGTALGLLLAEGRLSLDDLVSDHLPELFDDVSPATRQLKIRHIASMATGHDRETLLEAMTLDPTNVVNGFLQIPPDAEPGSLFAYNQPPVLTLATVIQRLTGERLSDYLRPRLLDPLGISGLRWSQFSAGLDMGFSGVHTNLDAIARLGQLYLDRGMHNGTRVLSAEWVAEASRKHIDNPLGESTDWQSGYGMQLWISQHGYRGDGAFGQYMIVLPEHDAVIAMFSCVEDMQSVLDLMWEHLLPAMHDASLPPSDSEDRLASQLEALTLPTARQRLSGTRLDLGALGSEPRRFEARELSPMSHRSLTSIDLEGDSLIVSEDDQSFVVGLTDGWSTGPGDSGPGDSGPGDSGPRDSGSEGAVSSSATLTPDGRIAVDLVFLDTPHRLEINLDLATSSFAATWPIMPLFGVGPASQLSKMKAPQS